MRSIMKGVFAISALFAAAGHAQERSASTPSLAARVAARTVIVNSPTPSRPRAAQPLTKADLDTWLDGYMPYALQVGDIPGAEVVVVKDGQILTARGFGYADVAKRTHVDPYRTLFRPGSVSKLFTWTAVMQLVEAHNLDLDQDVNRYLDFKIPDRNGKPITLRQILTHTAGFEENGDRVVFYDAKNLQSLGAFLKAFVPKRIFDAGTTPAYSNYATALAGYIVQRASGENFDTYVERHIFTPLGMRSSSFRQPLPAALASRLATPYPAPGETSGFEYVGPFPAGSLSLSGTDMARFMIAHLQEGQLGDARILQSATARMMHDSPLDRVDPASLIPPLNRMELGFFQMDVGHPGVIGHLGDINAFHTSLDLFMRENVGIYMSVNGTGKDKAGSALRLALPTDFANRYFPTDIADGRINPAIARQHAQMMVGLWDASRRANSNFFSVVYAFGETAVTVNSKGELVIPALVGPNGRPREWVEIAPFVWRDRNSHERLAAKVVDGKVVRWSFDMAAPWEVFDRVPAARSMTWIKPLLYTSIAILVLTFLYWPGAWFVRRRFKATIGVAGRTLGAYRATRIMAGLDLAVLAGWVMMISNLISVRPSGPQIFVPWLWLLQILGIVILPGAVLVSSWNAWITLHDDRQWPRKLWSVLIVLATLHILYFAATFGLIAMTVDY